MYKARYSSDSRTSQIFVLIGFVTLLLISDSSFGRVSNPGAVCSTGFSQDKLTDSDYTNLLASTSNNNYFDVTGNASGSIPLQIKMDLIESNISNTSNDLSIIGASQSKLINIGRNFSTPAAYTDIILSFRNSITQQPLHMTNVALSAFDVDYSKSGSNLFDDYVRITGITQSGAVIDGTLQTITGSNIAYAGGLNNTTTFNCSSRDLDTRCQGSVQFSQAVSTVTVRYTNNPVYVRSDPTNQEIQFRVDNYCYIPQYIFSGTVFDDNGGIPTASANKDNADITTASSVYANRPTYFNGVFNPSQELGISGSNVELANCANTSIKYTTQSVIKDGAPVGEYQISIPTTTLSSNTSLCLVESRTGTSYPIRTTSDSRNVGFVATKYNYPDNNFGRVIVENAALVLRKAQYVNNCPPSINYTASNLNTAGNTNPRTGFSEGSITDNLDPGQCIAYRITATNRANSPITNFVMQDKLQERGQGGALVTSVLANPIANTVDYASDSVPIGQNGVVKTNPFILPLRSNRDFYFNTKYGTTVNP